MGYFDVIYVEEVADDCSTSELVSDDLGEVVMGLYRTAARTEILFDTYNTSW